MKIKKEYTKRLVQICIITILAALLSKTVIYSFTSMPAFKSMVEVKDYQMSDFYNRVFDNRSVRELSKNIVIVPVDGLSRNQIAQVVEGISSGCPKAIGVDLLFEFPYESDSTLIESMRCPKVVMAAVDMNNGEIMTSYFCDSSCRMGMVNMVATSSGSVIREFIPIYSKGNSFAMEIIKDAYPSQYQKVIKRGTERRTIYFPSVEFPTISADSVYAGIGVDALRDKIVLVGDCDNMSDMHITPIGTMSGIKIQATIIETLIGEKNIKSISIFGNWLIAILSCMFFVALNIYVAKRIPAVGKLIIRIVQLLILYLYFAVGCWMFIHKQIYVDFSLSLAMIALGLLAYDLWIGIEALCKGIVKRIKHL